jgi:hypothetical protein
MTGLICVDTAKYLAVPLMMACLSGCQSVGTAYKYCSLGLILTCTPVLVAAGLCCILHTRGTIRGEEV